MRKITKGRRLRSMVELAKELGAGKDVVLRGELERNTKAKEFRWAYLHELVLAGKAFKAMRKGAA